MIKYKSLQYYVKRRRTQKSPPLKPFRSPMLKMYSVVQKS